MKIIRTILAVFCLLPMIAATNDSIGTAYRDRVLHAQWYSHSERIYRFVDIYVPDCYDACSDDSLPALLLLPGMGGYEGSWAEMADACDTLETLIAAGRCKPTLLVMPDCGPWPKTGRPSYHNRTLWPCMLRYPSLIHEHRVEYALSDLIDMVDSTYCVSSYTVAGLSDGARQAINLGNTRPDCIRRVAVFSPVWHWWYHQPVDSTQQYYVYAGERDFFYPYGKRFRRYLTKTNHPYEWVVFNEKHTWTMWRQCLSHFLEHSN